MFVVRWINMICAVLLAIGALGFGIYLGEKIVANDPEADDLWLVGAWFAVLATLAALCFANGAVARPGPDWRTITNGIAVLILALLIVLAWEDEVAASILTLCALGPAAGFAGLWIRPRATRS